MTNEEILKAADWCKNNGCKGCPLEFENCIDVFKTRISELETENANLSVENEVLKRDRDNYERTLEEANEELKDYQSKLKSGKLVEFKYAVGDEVYYIKYCGGETKVCECCGQEYETALIPYAVDKGIIAKQFYSTCGVIYYSLAVDWFGNGDRKALTDHYETELFSTKEEAEAKLKELQGV
jgi:FtsZ-binding cell division protein ZapB